MFPDISCPKCGNDALADRACHEDVATLPPFLPRSRITAFPAVVYQWACVSCGWEECVVRGPNGAAMWNRTWPKGKWEEPTPP